MWAELQSTTVVRIFRRLVARRRVIYVGGMVVISLPLLAATSFGVDVSRPTRLAVVVPTLILISAVYLGERRLDAERPAGTGTRTAPDYSLGSRLSITAAVVGFVVGIYVSLTGDPRVGAVYLLGSLLYGYREYRKQSLTEHDGRSRR